MQRRPCRTASPPPRGLLLQDAAAPAQLQAAPQPAHVFTKCASWLSYWWLVRVMLTALKQQSKQEPLLQQGATPGG